MGDFKKELEKLVNKYSKDNAADTPDFILADYLIGCLDVFEDTIQRKNQYTEQTEEVITK